MDNIIPGDLDLNIDSYFKDCLDDSDNESRPQVKETAIPDNLPTKVVDFYNHKNHSRFFKYDEKKTVIDDADIDNIAKTLNDKFQHIDLESNVEVLKHKENRRMLSEKLEADPEFRAKYIAEENRKRLNEDNLFQTVHNLPDDDDLVKKTVSRVKNLEITDNMRVYINHVENLHIHIHQ